jgi:hypothetical protein
VAPASAGQLLTLPVRRKCRARASEEFAATRFARFRGPVGGVGAAAHQHSGDGLRRRVRGDEQRSVSTSWLSAPCRGLRRPWPPRGLSRLRLLGWFRLLGLHCLLGRRGLLSSLWCLTAGRRSRRRFASGKELLRLGPQRRGAGRTDAADRLQRLRSGARQGCDVREARLDEQLCGGRAYALHVEK